MVEPLASLIFKNFNIDLECVSIITYSTDDYRGSLHPAHPRWPSMQDPQIRTCLKPRFVRCPVEHSIARRTA
ncbi:predicted protein [Sclerotinia sclerotiorum 1980 UF-70]|uniref:Uncharacterized protein n=1 Tax=Sclerotinia sclerotiorum (strain ATCC 18683 / 1980 / Ss-1) TaxID=665079 RepID=A7F564_SCLS1|nr:predicted protein [Sclerotinia sclerotiorum 1980 UF-70]EDN97885.1 predicted protein [Sclerotinia sclerotiorum 1980 UF-70]